MFLGAVFPPWPTFSSTSDFLLSDSDFYLVFPIPLNSQICCLVATSYRKLFSKTSFPHPVPNISQAPTNRISSEFLIPFLSPSPVVSRVFTTTSSSSPDLSSTPFSDL